MYAYTSCIHILAWYRKNYYAVPFEGLWSASLPAKRLKDPKFGAAGAVLSSILKICFKVAPPPFLWHLHRLVPGAKNAAKKPKEDESCCNSQRFTVKWRRCESFCRQKGSRNLHILKPWERPEGSHWKWLKCNLQEKNKILDKFRKPGWNFIVSCKGALLWGGTWQESLWIMRDSAGCLTSHCHCPFHVGWYVYVPLHQVPGSLARPWISVHKKCWTHKKYPSIRSPV